MTAMEHIFAQDAKKRAFIAQALLLVDELRKKLRKSEADTTSKATESKHTTTEITKEMIFDRIKETKILREKNARMLREVWTPINWSIPRRSIFFKVSLAK